jgi:hypothetical protein
MRAGLAACLLAVALPCAAQPRLTNAKVTERALAGSLQDAVRDAANSGGALWLGWAAPVADGRSTMCCYRDSDFGGGRCHLEPGSSSTMMSRNPERVNLEVPESFFVFVRVENRVVERVRMFSEDCEIEAGAVPITWLTGVPAGESVTFLSATALIRLAREVANADLRGDALFWLSQRAGARAAAAITDAIENDPETQVKKKAVFALSQLPPDEGVPKLIAIAKSHQNPAVRKQAMFWLGQSRDPRALAFFEEILK